MDSFIVDKFKITDYILCYILVAISGVNFFLGNPILAIVFMGTFIIFYKTIKITNFIVFYLLAVAVILLGSALDYSSYNFNNYLSLFSRIGIAYIILYVLGNKFIYLYIKIMYYLSIISLFFWSIFVLSPGLERIFVLNITPLFDHYFYEMSKEVLPAPHFIIYTMNHEGINIMRTGLEGAIASLSGFDRIFMRNSVCFTEPSTAMYFIIPALAFSLAIYKKITRKEIIIFILVIITSWSTGGFAVLFFLLAGWYFIKKGRKNKLLMFPISLLIAYYTFMNVESFGLEITTKIDEVRNTNLEYAKRTRLVNAVLDVEESLKHPLFGKGFYVEARPLTYYDWRTNGTTFLLNRYGYIAFVIYFFLIYKFFNLICYSFNINKQFALIMLVSLILIGFGNKNFEKPLFIGLTMIYSIAKSKSNDQSNYT